MTGDSCYVTVLEQDKDDMLVRIIEADAGANDPFLCHEPGGVLFLGSLSLFEALTPALCTDSAGRQQNEYDGDKVRHDSEE